MLRKSQPRIPRTTKSLDNLSLLTRQGPGKPVEAFVKAIARGGTSRLNVPLPLTEVVQAQLLRHLGSSHRVWQVLLVREHEEDCIAHLVLVQHLRQLLPGILAPIAVVAVDHVDEAICALVVMAPQWADLV